MDITEVGQIRRFWIFHQMIGTDGPTSRRLSNVGARSDMTMDIKTDGAQGKMATDRVKVVPVYSAWGRIQGWAVNYRNTELAFRASRLDALNIGGKFARIAKLAPPGESLETYWCWAWSVR